MSENFFKKTVSKLSDFGTDVAMQAKLMADISKVKSSIKDQEKKLREAYADLGKAYYARRQAAMKRGEEILPEDISAFEAIEAPTARIEKLKEELAKLQEKK